MSERPTSGLFAVKQLALQRALPINAILEITYACNWRCVFCFNPRHFDRQRLSAFEWTAVLDGLRELGTLFVTLTGGEPLTHPEILTIARAVRERHMALRLFTNGSLIDATMAQEIASLCVTAVEMSLHGATEETHDRATGQPGSFSAMMKAVTLLVACDVPLRLKTPLTSSSEHELEAMVRLTGELGIDYSIDPNLIPRDDGDLGPLTYAPSSDGLRKLLQLGLDGGSLKPVAREVDGTNCGLGTMTVAVDPEGNVYPCRQWRHRPLGNVRQQTIVELWRGESRRETAEIAREANRRLLEAEQYVSEASFCPALAFRQTGDPLGIGDSFREVARLRRDLKPE